MSMPAGQRAARHAACAVACLFGVLTVTTNPASANELPSREPAVLTLTEAAELLRIDVDEMRRLAEQNEVPARRIGALWRFNRASLLAWLNGDWERVSDAGAAPDARRASLAPAAAHPELTPNDLAALTAAGTGGSQADSAATRTGPWADDAEEATIGEAPEERTAEDILLRGQRVLLGPSEAVLDFGQFYAESNGQPLALIDGGVAQTVVEQEAFLTSLQGRIGLRNETELFLGTTYFKQDGGVFFGSEKLASSGTSDFGNLNLGARHTLMREGPGRPDIIGTLVAQIPTGDTSYALGAGLAFVKSIDPAVLFATVNYTHTFSRNFTNVLLLEPKDRIDIGVGYALALNDTLALSMSIGGAFTGASRFDNAVLRQRDSYSLRFGLTSWLARGVYIEPSVSLNLGGPDDSFVFGLTVPYTLGRRSLN